MGISEVPASLDVPSDSEVVMASMAAPVHGPEILWSVVVVIVVSVVHH